MRTHLLALAWILLVPTAWAQDRDTKVRNDRATFGASPNWIYNDLAEGLRAAEAAEKPLLVVFRCIPCEACQEFDDDVARRDPIIRDLLDEFVCVRLVQANTIDLTTFQHDFDLSFAAYLMAPDRTIYGRFGTRSDRPEIEDISLSGLRLAMQAALQMHRAGPAARPPLAGKQAKPGRLKTPRDDPGLRSKYGEALDYQGQVAKSCLHCHQVREAERLAFRSAGESIPDEVLFPYPDPATVGLKLDPEAMAKVERVAAGSPADAAGLQVGDEIATLAGQPLVSIADFQWVLHNAPARAELPARVRRDGQVRDLTLDLPEGWRRGNISWRATTWDLRRMGLGGLKLAEASDQQRAAAKIPRDALALRVEHVGEYGDHAIAKRAGFRKGDLLVSFDGQTRRMSESELLAFALQQKQPGNEVAVIVHRDGARRTLKLALQ